MEDLMKEFGEATQLQQISEITNQNELKLVEIKEELKYVRDNMLTKEYVQEQLEKNFQEILTKFGEIIGGSSADEGVSTKSTGIGDPISGSVAQPSDSHAFCVDTSEEAKSYHLDSPYQVLSNVESHKVTSISSAMDKENDDSAVGFQFREIGEIGVNGINSKNSESLQELAIIHVKLHCQDCFYTGLDDSRSIFDRGKYAVLPPIYFEQLIHSLGFKSDFGFLDWIIPLSIHDTEIYVDGKVLDKILPRDTVCFELKFFFHHTLPTGISSHRCFRSADKLFDTGKEFPLVNGLFSFVGDFENYLGPINSRVIFHTEFTFMAAYCEKFAYEPIVEYEYCFILLYDCSKVALFVKEGYSHANSQLFENSPQQHHIPWTFVNFQVRRHNGSGNEQKLIDQWLASYRFLFYGVSNSGSFILNLGSISICYHTEKFVHEFVSKHGFESDTLLCASLKLVLVPPSDYNATSKLVSELSARNRFLFLLLSSVVSIQKAHTWFAQVLGVKGGENFFFQLPCELLEVLAVHLMCLTCVVKSEGARIPVLNSASARIISRSWTCDADDILLPSVAMVLHDLLMLMFGIREADVLLGALLRVSDVDHEYPIMLERLLQEFHYMSMLVFSVPTSVKVFSHFSRLGYFLPAPNIYSSYMMRVGIILGTQVLFMVFHFQYLWLLVDFLRWKYKLYTTGLGNAATASLTISVFMEITEAQLMPRVIQLLRVRLLVVGYLRWKLKLFLLDLWSYKLCAARIRNGIVANCVAKPKCVTAAQFLEQELLTSSVGSALWGLSSGADDILCITHAFSHARKVFAGNLLELKSYGREQAVQLSHTVIHILAVSKSVACASKVLWSILDCTSEVLVTFHSQILEQLDNHKGNGNYMLKKLAPICDDPLIGILVCSHGHVGTFHVQPTSSICTEVDPVTVILCPLVFIHFSTVVRKLHNPFVYTYKPDSFRSITKSTCQAKNVPATVATNLAVHLYMGLLTTTTAAANFARSVTQARATIIHILLHDSVTRYWDEYSKDATLIADLSVSHRHLSFSISPSSLRTRMFSRGVECHVPGIEGGCPYHIYVGI